MTSTAETNVNTIFDIEIIKLLESVAGDQGFTDYTIVKTGESMKGDGYLGVITMVEIRSNSNSFKRKLCLVVKSARKSDVLRKEMPIAEVFKREIYMYDFVIPLFQQVLSERGLQRYPGFANCYKASVINKSEALILENLMTKGFRLWERRIPMNEEHVSLVMKQYGRFHALSFALKSQNPAAFVKVSDDLYDIFGKFFEKEKSMDVFINACNSAAEGLSSDEDSQALHIFKMFIGKITRFILDLPNLVDNYSVILHGDCWTNNMMFGYDDTSSPQTPTKMCFIDLQISRLGPPVLDLAYFIYACSSKEIIDNYHHYLDIYYSSLSAYLIELGLNPEKVYPYPVFLKQWNDNAKFGLLMSFILIRIMMSELDEVADIAELAESGKTISEVFDYPISKADEFNDRIKHNIMHFVNNKFI